MGYMHIDNLYKSQEILLFRECYALEKVHGTSAHLGWKDSKVSFFSGGEKHANFVAMFNQDDLVARFALLGHPTATVYGEAYGGKCQGMSSVYGKAMQFIVFDVQIGDSWLAVPDMDQVATGLGLEVVPYRKVDTAIEVLDAERDRFSEVAGRRGCGDDKLKEGIVLRPLIELAKNNGARIIAKHKIEKFSERATPQKIVDPDKLAVLGGAMAIAQEWVNEMRLTHVLQAFSGAGIEKTGDIIKAMIADVYREANGEIVESKEATQAIGKRTAMLFKKRLKAVLHQQV